MKEQLKMLHRGRSRNSFVRLSLVIMLLLIGYTWIFGGFLDTNKSFPQRAENIERFLKELQPYKLRGESFSIQSYLSWTKAIMIEKGAQAVYLTLAISVAAIVPVSYTHLTLPTKA